MKQKLGPQGEDLAAAYLLKQGYEIIERNYRCRAGEVDIICRQNRNLVFVEVKARRSLAFGSPEEAVTLKKQDTIRRVALHWLQASHSPLKDVRFDVIGIMMRGEEPEIHHIKNAF